MLETLDSLLPFLLAVSLTTERFVTVIKTLVPLLAVERKTQAQEVDKVADAPRATVVLLLSVAGAYLTVGLVSGRWHLLAPVEVGGKLYSVGVLALLGSGSSAFWNNVLGYTRAAKDTKVAARAATAMEFHEKAKGLGLTPRDSGVVARMDGFRNAIRTDKAS